MKNLILAIESSCDDSCISVIDDKFNIVFERNISQIDIHKIYGGVVPELASRCHVKYLQGILYELKMEVSIDDISAVGVTFSPGLIGGLLSGVMMAKGICHMYNKLLIGIHHLEGHLESVNIEKEKHVKYPNLTLLVSGGHCQFILAKSFGNYAILGKTIDDSVGEAFDKIGKMLGLEYPGGSKIEQKAKNGKNIMEIGKPMIDGDMNFSFSGFKTNVLRFLDNNKDKMQNVDFISDVCFTVQQRIADNLVLKTKNAIKYAKNINPEIQNFTLCGGVSANQKIIADIQNLCNESHLTLHFPKLKYATDNSTMIAFAALKRYNLGYRGNLDLGVKSRVSIEEINIL